MRLRNARILRISTPRLQVNRVVKHSFYAAPYPKHLTPTLSSGTGDPPFLLKEKG
jgi:hypothetical protein